MESKNTTICGVYIIESLSPSDENENTSEGQILYQMLTLAKVKCIYKYIRTERELEVYVNDFRKSRYRYLHISCHGAKDRIATTLDQIPFEHLSAILLPNLDHRRLFLSSCLATNQDLADMILPYGECYSIIGHDVEVNIDAAAIFWTSFYFAILESHPVKMTRSDIKKVLKTCSRLYHVPVKYFISGNEGRVTEVNIDNYEV